MINLTKELETAIKACRNAGDYVAGQFSNYSGVKYKDKGIATLVSDVDVEAEKMISDTLTNGFPDYSFYGEESGVHPNDSPNMWVVDPLDGTNNFALGIPLIAVSVSLLRNGFPQLGVIYHPITKKLFYAEIGTGAFQDNRILKSNDTKRNERLTISLISGYAAVELAHRIHIKLAPNVKRIISTWSPGIDYSLIANGDIDIILSINSEIEDQIGGLVIAKESGAVIKDVNGEDFWPSEFSEILPTNILAKDQETYTRFIDILNSTGAIELINT